MPMHSPSRTFDLVVGFGGVSTIPHIVASALAKFVTRRVVDGYSAKDALTRSLVCDIDALKSSPVVYVTPRSTADRLEAIATMVATTAPPARVWGFDFVGCPDKKCPGKLRFDTQMKSGYDNAKFECMDCGAKSKRFKVKSDVPFITQWDNAHPTVFSFNFPPAEKDIAFWRLYKPPPTPAVR